MKVLFDARQKNQCSRKRFDYIVEQANPKKEINNSILSGFKYEWSEWINDFNIC